MGGNHAAELSEKLRRYLRCITVPQNLFNYAAQEGGGVTAWQSGSSAGSPGRFGALPASVADDTNRLIAIDRQY